MVLVDYSVEDTYTQVGSWAGHSNLLKLHGQTFKLPSSYWLTETERAKWVLSVQSREAWLVDLSSGVRWAVSCLDDGRQHPAGHPRLHPHLHGVPDHSVLHFIYAFVFAFYLTWLVLGLLTC